MLRAIGIVRVSQVAGREGEAFASPAEQRDRIATACERDGLTLVETVDELDVSGGTPLERRDGLRGAVEAIEDGRADVLMVAYFDRLVRSLRVQGEVVGRVERAGGRVVALDFGEVSEATATQWITGTFMGAVAEYHRRASRERSGEAQARAVARGVAPWPQIPPGYRRRDDGVLEPDELAAVVGEAFGLRLGGATIKEVRAFLREHGIERSYHGVQAMLASRVYLGELRFGELHNPAAHEPIVERVTWEAVQGERRGARQSSDRLLARLGVLRCGTCGSRMVVGMQTQNGRRYPFYRCPPVGDCPRRVTIGAEMVERFVVERVKVRHAELRGRASVEADAQRAEERAERAQGDLDAAIRAFSGMEAEAAVVERLRELRDTRDEAVRAAGHLRGLSSVVEISVADFEHLSLEARRGIIRAAVAGVRVAPGRGLGRVTVRFTQ